MEDEENSFSDVSFTQESYNAFHTKIDQFFSRKKLTDVNITCSDGREFKCHRLVLATASEYFEKMFCEDWRESNAENTVLQDVDGTEFENVVQFAYKGTVDIDDENVFNLLYLSDRFRIPILEGRCLRYLTERNIPMNHALYLFSFACATHKVLLIPSVSRFILNHLELFHGDADGLRSITFNDMKTLLTYWRPSSNSREQILVELLKRWVSHAVLNHLVKKSTWLDFVRTLHFNHIPKDFLERCFDEREHVDDSDLPSRSSGSRLRSLHVYVRNVNACNLYTMKSFKDGIDWGPQVKSQRPAGRMKTVAVPGSAAGKMKTVAVDDRLFSYALPTFPLIQHDHQSLQHYFRLAPVTSQQLLSYKHKLEFSSYSSARLSDKQSLRTPADFFQMDSLIKRPTVRSFDTVSICSDWNNSRIYLHHDLDSELETNLFAYDCGTQQWFPLQNNNNDSEASIVTFFDHRLYTIRSNNVAQAYDPRVEKWEYLSNTKLFHSIRDKCCCHKGKIYASSEIDGEKPLNGSQVRLEVYDPVAGRWSVIAPTPATQRMSRLGWLLSFENKLWMVGGNDYFETSSHNLHNYYVQRYDSFSQRWGKAYRLLHEEVNNVMDVTIF